MLKASGRMSVGRFEKEFEDEFGVKCQIKDGRKLADDNATLASLRPDDFKGPKTVDFTIRGNMLIKNIKEKFNETFGSNIQLYNKNRVAPDEITLGAFQEEVEETTLSDEQIAEFKEQEAEAEDSYDYCNLAKEIAEAGDKDWARKVYQKAIDKAKNSRDLNRVADSIAYEDYLGDKDFAREVYQKAIDKTEYYDDLKRVADSIAHEDYLGDKDFAREVYQKAIDKAEKSSDLKRVAESIAHERYLGDKDFAREVYQKAIDKAEYYDDLTYIANSIAYEDYLGDKDFAREVYQKAIDKAENSDDLRMIADSIADESYLGDKDWAREVSQKEIDKAKEKKIMNKIIRVCAEKIENAKSLAISKASLIIYVNKKQNFLYGVASKFQGGGTWGEYHIIGYNEGNGSAWKFNVGNFKPFDGFYEDLENTARQFPEFDIEDAKIYFEQSDMSDIFDLFNFRMAWIGEGGIYKDETIITEEDHKLFGFDNDEFPGCPDEEGQYYDCYLCVLKEMKEAEEDGNYLWYSKNDCDEKLLNQLEKDDTIMSISSMIPGHTHFLR